MSDLSLKNLHTLTCQDSDSHSYDSDSHSYDMTNDSDRLITLTVLTQWDAWQIEYDSKFMAEMNLQLKTWCRWIEWRVNVTVWRSADECSLKRCWSGLETSANMIWQWLEYRGCWAAVNKWTKWLKSWCWWTAKIEKCVATILMRELSRWSAVLTSSRIDWRNRWCWYDSEL